MKISMSSYQVSAKELEAVLKLSGNDRYKRFVKLVADWEEAWGLYDEGWALANDDDGNSVFLLWPADKFAEICATDDWGRYKPTAIPLTELINDLLPMLKEDSILPGIFYIPKGSGVTPSVDRLIADLKMEASKYE